MRPRVATAIVAAVSAAGWAMFGLALASQPATAASPQPTPVTWQDENTTSCAPDLLLLDHNQAPIFWALNCGGVWVGNDKLGVTNARLGQVAFLWSPDGVHGALVVDGQTLTGRDIAFLHMLEKIPGREWRRMLAGR